MAEEIDIGNVGGSGVASEATLARLLTVMQNMDRNSKGAGGSAGKTQDAYNKAQASGVLWLGKNTKALDTNTSQVKKHSRALNGAIKGLTSLGGAVLGQVIGAFTNLTSVALGSSTELKDFAETVPFVGGILGAFAGILDTNLSAFRSLSQQGALFGDGILGMTRAAASAQMPLDMFVGLIQENATRMQMFGGTTAQAALTFGAMSKEFRNGPGKELQRIGFSVMDLNELLLDYAEYQDMQLGIQSRSDNLSLKSAKEYGLQLNELAAITGKSRKQIAEEMKQRMADSRQQQALDMMDDDQKENFERVQAMAGKFGPMMSEAVLDMSDGIPTKNSVAASMMPMSETFRDQAKNLKDMSRKEQEQFFVTVNAEAAEYKKKFGKSYQAVIAAGGPMADAFRASMEIAKARVTTEKELEAEAIRIAKENQKDTAIKDFQGTVVLLRAKFNEIFFKEDGPLSKLTTYFEGLLKSLGKKENLEKFETAINNISDSLVKFFEKIETMVLNFNKYDLKTAIFGGKKGTETAGGVTLTEDVQGIFGDPNKEGGLTDLLGSAIGAVITGMFTGWEIPWGTVFVGGLAAIGTLIAAPILGIPGALLVGLTAIFGFQAVKDMFSGAVSMIKGAGQTIKDTWNTAKVKTKETFDAAVANIKAVGTTIGDAWNDTTAKISENWNTAKSNIKDLGKTISDAWDDTTAKISENWNTAKSNIKAVGTTIADAWDDTKQGISTKWNTAKESVVAVGTGIKDAMTWENIKSTFTDAKTGVTNVANGIAGVFGWGDEEGGAKGMFESAWTNVTAVGTGIMSKFGGWETVKGISWQDEFSKIWTKVREFFTFDFTMPNFRDFLPTWLGGKGKEIGEGGNLPPEMSSKVETPDTTDAVSKAGVLNEARQAVATIIDIPTLKSALQAIREGMDAVKVQSYADALASVAEQLQAINEAGKDQKTSVTTRRGTKTVNQQSAAGKYLNTEAMNQKMSATELNTLNTTMLSILEELQAQSPHIKKTAKKSSNVANDVYGD